MKTLLQRIQDGLYYQGPGMWTSDPDFAFVFQGTTGAIDCCVRENLPPMQLVLKFEDSAFDIRMPCVAGNVAALMQQRTTGSIAT